MVADGAAFVGGAEEAGGVNPGGGTLKSGGGIGKDDEAEGSNGIGGPAGGCHTGH